VVTPLQRREIAVNKIPKPTIFAFLSSFKKDA
jgi:hypothetical protein